MPSYTKNYIYYLLFHSPFQEDAIFSTIFDLKIDYNISNFTSSGIQFETCEDTLLFLNKQCKSDFSY